MPESAVQATFGVADWIVVLIYLLAMTAIGLWAARGQASNRDYFLGGRSLSWWMVGISIVATETSALTFIGVPAMVIGKLAVDASGAFSAAGGNMFFTMIVIGYVTGRLIVVKWIIPKYFTGDVYTTYQLINRAFGKQSRYAVATLSMVASALGAGVRVYVTAIPIMIVMRTVPGLEWWGIWQSVWLIVVAALGYTALGGIKAVVWTDMVQYFIYFGAGVATLVYVPSLLEGARSAPSGAEHWAAVTEMAGEHMKWFNSGFVSATDVAAKLGREAGLWDVIKGNVASILASPFNIVMGLIAAPVGIVLAFGFDQMNVHRVLACKNARDGQKAMLLSAAIIPPQFVLFLLIGAALLAFYRINGFDFGDTPPWDPTKPPVPKADFVFPIFILTHMPPIMKGFLIAAILSAAMSSVSAALGAMGSMAVMDFYKPLKGGKTDARTEMFVSRASVIASALALIAVAQICQHATLIFNLAFQLAGLTAGAILGAFVFGFAVKRGHPGPVMAGMFASFAFMILFNWILAATKIDVMWPWHALIGMTVCLAVSWVASIGVPKPEHGGIDQADE